MRIAVYHNLPSGGAKRTLSEACTRLAARHELDVYSLSTSDQDFADLRARVRRHREYRFSVLPRFNSPLGRLNPLSRLADLVRLRRLARRIGTEIDSLDYDVALVHPCRFEQSPSILRYLERTPSVYYCHEPLRFLYEDMPERPYNKRSLRQKALDRLDPLPTIYRRRLLVSDQANVRSAGRVLVNSAFTAETVKRVYQVRPQVSYHGVDVDLFRPLGVPRHHMVLSVGSLTPLKGFDFLIRAMARYPAATRPPLVIASNFEITPERVYLERLTRELDVQVDFRTGISDQELVRLYSQAPVVAYAPVREPFGLVPLEAMACATPVVAVAEGGIPESVVDGETGFLVARDEGRFARALRQVIEDPALAERLGGNGLAHVRRNWTWDASVRGLEQQLLEAVRQSIS